MAQSDTKILAARVSQALQERDRIGLVRGVMALIDARAPLTTGWKSLTEPLIDYGELDLARRAIDLYAQALGDSPAALFDRALIYTRTAKAAEALKMLAALSPDVPDRAGNAFLRGTIALNLGDLEVARAALCEALAARPRSGQIMQSLTMLGSMAIAPELADIVLGAEMSMRNMPDSERGAYLYALGKTLDDMKETDRAFAAFSEGAAIIARMRPYDNLNDRRTADDAVNGWDRAAIDAVGEAVSVDTARPIIVTGLPRSGSTLVEQILVSHSAVHDGDELGGFARVVEGIGGTTRQRMDQWTQRHAINEASRHYLHVLAQRFGKAGRVVDKTLEASRYLGVLAAIMPEAPIIWMRRDPLDTAWSCFHTYFLRGLSWSWSQTALAEHMKLEDALFARWQSILGERLHVVDYAALVSDKETVIPQILAHCGLTMEPAVFAPERTKRLVTTASVMQVRSPIHARAIGSASRYERHLQPFIEAYGYRP